MNHLTLTVWLINMLCDTVGQLTFKKAAILPGDGMERWIRMARSPWLWAGIACYCVEFFAWLAFLSMVPLSIGVLLGSINIILIMIAGRLLFAERITRLRLAGILLVAAGVVTVGGSV
jgi:drug/metabolite transporter (DMT)-like permease